MRCNEDLIKHEIKLLRDRLPLEEDTSVEIVHLCQQLHGGVADQPLRPRPLDRGRLKLL